MSTFAGTAPDTRRAGVTTIALAAAGWMVAAALVLLIHREHLGVIATGTAALAAILIASGIYTKATARAGGVPHALGVGVLWLLLTIVAEITVTAITGRQWFLLCGDPAHALFRTVLMFAWVFGPSLFARAAGD